MMRSSTTTTRPQRPPAPPNEEAAPNDVASAAPEEPAATANAPGVWPIYALTLVLSTCSIVYELLVARTVTLLAANTVVWFSACVALYLGGMGLGSLRSARLGRDRSLWAELFRVEIGLTALGAAAVFLVHAGHIAYSFLSVRQDALLLGLPWGEIAFFATAFGVSSGIGYLTGIELPLLMRIARARRDAGEVANTVLGLDYVGGLIGSVAFPLALLPSLPLLGIGIATAAANLLVAAYVFVRHLGFRGRAFAPRLLACGGLAVALAWTAIGAERVQQYLLRKYYYYIEAGDTMLSAFAPLPHHPEVLRVRSPYQRIDLIHDVNPDYTTHVIRAQSDKFEQHPTHPVDHILFLNGDFQTNTSFDEVYHEYFAHVPLMSRDAVPERILLLGGGDGFLARELLKYDAVERIDHVDIDPALPELARTDDVLRAANRGAFDDPRVESIRADGFQFMRRSDQQWDAIYIDFPMAVDYDLAKLYSREFFTFVRRRLAPGGFAVFDSTGISLISDFEDGYRQTVPPNNDWFIYHDTLAAAGFTAITPYLSTLEHDDEAALQVLHDLDLNVSIGADFVNAWNAAETDEERARLRGLLTDGLLRTHVLGLQQGFIMLGANEPTFTWRDRDVEFNVLNEARLDLAFRVEFPQPDHVDPDRVNSLLRPRFPSASVWTPRLPY